MKPSFVLLHAESINVNKDSVCHIILVPVVEGVRQEPKVFLVNPKSDFDMVMSGITREQVESAPDFESVWPQIRDSIEDAPYVICSAEGNSVITLMGTVARLGLTCPETLYMNAKAICRRTMDHFTYCLEFLAAEHFDRQISYNDPIEIAEIWTDLAVKGLESAPEEDFNSFAKAHKIRIGMFSSEEIHPSLCMKIKPYVPGKQPKFDPSGVELKIDPEHPLFESNIVFTGKLESMTRTEARTAVVAIGGNAPDRLTMDTNILVVGNQDLYKVGEKGVSGKMKKAAEYKAKGCDIEVINESDFIDMLGVQNIYKKPAPEQKPKYDNFEDALNARANSMSVEEMEAEIEMLRKFRESLGI